jgi:DNA repair exonuclease SbcCD ATPase subunit
MAAAVLELLEADILRPSVVEQAIALALDTLWSEATALDRRVTLAQQLSDTEAKLRQLTAAVEQGGQLSTLLGAIERREQECARLRGEVEALGRVLVPPRKDRKALERALRARLADWRGLLRSQGAEARQVLETLLEERLVFTPTRDERDEACYQLRGTFAFGRIFARLLRSHGMASPTGTAASWIPMEGVSDYLRAA